MTNLRKKSVRGETTYDPRIDRQSNNLLAPLALGRNLIREDSDAAAFVAHEHVALIRRDDIELRQYHRYISDDMFPWVRTRKVIYISKMIQGPDRRLFIARDIDGRWETWVDVFFLGDALCETAQAAGVTEVGIDVDAGICVEREFCGLLDAPTGGGDEEDATRGRECGCWVAEGGVEGQGGVSCVVEDADGDELGGCAVSVDD
jgi:hypothetical protein